HAPEAPLALHQVDARADQDPEDQGDLDRPRGAEAVLDRSEAEGSSCRRELEEDEQEEQLLRGESESVRREDSGEGDDRGEARGVQEEDAQEADELGKVRRR